MSIVVGLVVVGLVSLVTFFEAWSPTRRELPRARGRDLFDLMLKVMLSLLRRLGMSDGWIMIVSGGLTVACAVGVAYLFVRAGAERRREKPAV
jgi:hypothetical protein